MLRTYVKIGLTWVVVTSLIFGVTLVLPHRDLNAVGVFAIVFDLLVAVCCFFVAVREINKRTSVLFSYIGVFFLFTALSWALGALMGKAFMRNDPFASLYWNQYQWAVYFLLLLFVIVFGVMEVVTRKLTILHKSLLSFFLAGIPFFLLYHPFFLNPKYLYTKPEVKDFAALSQAVSNSLDLGNGIPEINQLVIEVDLPSQYSQESFEQKRQRVAELLPYLEGENYKLLILKPSYLNAFYMSMIGLAVLLAMLGYCYWNDWPKSAYLEKILLAFVPICVLECIHAFFFVILSDFQVFRQIFGAGTILTRVSYAFLLFFLVLRLNFISSPAGNFYENKLSTDPHQVSRWRDFLDEFIIRRFLNPQKLGRRLFFIHDSTDITSSPSNPNQ